ncbi:hypothetical protein L1285_22745 [Pseudoalteromonas sp. DL2-H2.2]|uniref:hypothetical protein n=1 Tax=Pseudoalteromonas sp. DL2-H2.2 TaxID=2908889 RepID=UPI001F36EC3A|nr:hypothetical protein [Pseudoalteromonas sp. DL2-H2.2]MCF2911123.1 hypothetical protein [Pseudoalteromonas sp. DL2-H2.2]
MLDMLRNGELSLAPFVFAVQAILFVIVNLTIAHKYHYSKKVALGASLIPFVNFYVTLVYIAIVILNSRKALPKEHKDS